LAFGRDGIPQTALLAPCWRVGWLDVRTRKQHGRLNALSGYRDRIIKIAQN
jgi:hypothetical protein